MNTGKLKLRSSPGVSRLSTFICNLQGGPARLSPSAGGPGRALGGRPPRDDRAKQHRGYMGRGKVWSIARFRLYSAASRDAARRAWGPGNPWQARAAAASQSRCYARLGGRFGCPVGTAAEDGRMTGEEEVGDRYGSGLTREPPSHWQGPGLNG
jgi:hypothetical protein